MIFQRYPHILAKNLLNNFFMSRKIYNKSHKYEFLINNDITVPINQHIKTQPLPVRILPSSYCLPFLVKGIPICFDKFCIALTFPHAHFREESAPIHFVLFIKLFRRLTMLRLARRP